MFLKVNLDTCVQDLLKRTTLSSTICSPDGLVGFNNYFVCKRFTVPNLLWSLEFMIKINLEHNTIAV